MSLFHVVQLHASKTEVAMVVTFSLSPESNVIGPKPEETLELLNSGQKTEKWFPCRSMTACYSTTIDSVAAPISCLVSKKRGVQVGAYR